MRSRTRVAAGLVALVVVAGACSSGDSASDDDTEDAPPSVAAIDQPAPEPEVVEVSALPLPPTAPSDEPGSCTNPTGCISATDRGITEGPSYMWDGEHVVLPIEFAGAPADSVYRGPQVIAIRTDGSTFAGGDAWKCLTCGVPDANKVGASPALDHPQPFHDGERMLAGTNIVDCSPYLLVDDECTPDAVRIFPISWQVTPDGSGRPGSMRELRLHPDDVHLGWNHIILDPLDEFAFIGRLVFNESPEIGTPLVPRYDLENVNVLFSDDPRLSGTFLRVDPDDPAQLVYDEPAGAIGEFRGWTSDGQNALGFGIEEAANFDVYATSLETGESRRLSRNPAYVDPMKASPDDEWNVIMDSRVDDRMMFIAGLPGIPPLTDQVSGVPYAVSSMRNNRNRRFFQPYLLDRYGDRGDYDGQQLNACGDDDDPEPGSGSICDPLWNGRADPAWSPDGTQVVYWQALVTSPSCGGENPLACPDSKEPGGRRTRLMLAELTSREPLPPTEVEPVPDTVPWGTPYNPGDPFPTRYHLPAGDYVLEGRDSGTAAVTVTEDASGSVVTSIAVTYTDYSNDGETFLNGTERAERVGDDVTWHEDLELTGEREGSKVTSAEGFTVSVGLSALAEPVFDARGTMTTTIDGDTYTQPQNGT